MAPDEEIATPETLSLSFIDVLSCGLGGAILLFLIFAIMPHIGAASQLTDAGGGSAASLSPIGAQQFTETGFQSGEELFAVGLSPVMVTVRPLSPSAFPAPPAWGYDREIPVAAVGPTAAMLFFPRAAAVADCRPELVMPAGPQIRLQIEVIPAGDAREVREITVALRTGERPVFRLRLPTLEDQSWIEVLGE
jgi:hypothetical protein